MSATLAFFLGVIFSAAVFFVAGLCSAAHKPTIPQDHFFEPHDLDDGGVR